MTEQEKAKQIAETWLEFIMNPYTQVVAGDPDCDACVLARQFLRAMERLEKLADPSSDFAEKVASLEIGASTEITLGELFGDDKPPHPHS